MIPDPVRQLAQEVEERGRAQLLVELSEPRWKWRHRIAPLVEFDLDDIWLYVARESGSIEMADRLIEMITDRFPVIGKFPRIGRTREHAFMATQRGKTRWTTLPELRVHLAQQLGPTFRALLLAEN